MMYLNTAQITAEKRPYFIFENPVASCAQPYKEYLQQAGKKKEKNKRKKSQAAHNNSMVQKKKKTPRKQRCIIMNNAEC